MSGKETLTWEEFLDACSTFENLTENLEPSWKFVQESSHVGGRYLKCSVITKTRFLNSEQVEMSPESTGTDVQDAPVCMTPENLVSCDYHVVYNMAYSVPVLYFNISQMDGRCCSLEDVWSIFLGRKCTDADSALWSAITQQDHPLLHVPYFTLHPCQTSELMKTLTNNQENSALSYLVTWLSIVGAQIGLFLPIELAQVVKQGDEKYGGKSSR